MNRFILIVALLVSSTAWAVDSRGCTTPVTVCENPMWMPDTATEITLTDGTLLRFVPSCTYGMSGGIVYDVFAIHDACDVQKADAEIIDGNGGVERDSTIGCKDIWQDKQDPDLIHCADSGYRLFTYEPGILRLESQVEFIPGEGPDAAMDETVITTYTRKRR